MPLMTSPQGEVLSIPENRIGIMQRLGWAVRQDKHPASASPNTPVLEEAEAEPAAPKRKPRTARKPIPKPGVD